MSALAPYDAVLLVSFGGPEREEDVLPFMQNVTRGRGIPEARLREVSEHYYRRGGVSPINSENRALIAALERELQARGETLPVLWGNRNLDPFIAEALQEAHDRGLHRLLAVFTSAYSSYSSCRQYRENLADAVAELGPAGADLSIDKLAAYAPEPAFVEPMIRLTGDAVADLLAREGATPERTRLLFVTHSIPEAMNAASGPPEVDGVYRQQHLGVAAAVAGGVCERIGEPLEWELTYCSRSGPPTQPWLEPDISDALERLAEQGVTSVAVVPIGFVADHMEVVHDLDDEARETADRLGMSMVRVSTVRAEPDFVAGLVDLMLDRAALARSVDAGDPDPARTTAVPAVCPAGCCANARGPRPALCGRD